MRRPRFDAGWSPEPVPPQERGPAPEGVHIHSCGCDRFRACRIPIDQCDDPDECPWCVDARRAAFYASQAAATPATVTMAETAAASTAPPVDRKPRREPRKWKPPIWNNGKKPR